MDLADLAQALRDDAVWIVFVNVLLQQLGLPVPAVPTLMVAGSLAGDPFLAGRLLAAAIAASVAADGIWYLAGRAFGYRVLAGLCRLSINPASCVSQTEGRFLRWGLWSLVVAKFIPGFSTVAPPIAGALRMSWLGFGFAAGVGAALWSGLALAAGWMFQGEIQVVVAALQGHGGRVAALLALLFAAWLGWKFWQKRRFERRAVIPRISPEELLAALVSAQPPLLLDLRGAVMIGETGLIPGAVPADYDALPAAVGDWPKAAPIVTICACPEDAGAIQAARDLQGLGFLSVRPLHGGYEALPPSLRPAGAGRLDPGVQPCA